MFRSVQAYLLDLPNHGPLDFDDPAKIKQVLPDGLLKAISHSHNRSAVTKV
jgi:hypothetical protein